MTNGTLLSFCLALASGAGLAVGVEFHVATDGSDAGPGTVEKPFQSVVRARDAVRAAKADGGATVWLHGGTYTLLDPVEFTAEDSGSRGAPVVYRAVEGEAVWLSGGLPLPLAEFTPVTDAAILARLDPTARSAVRQFAFSQAQRARLSPAWPDTWWTYERQMTGLTELFADGERLPMARWPNEGYSTFGEITVAGGADGQTPTFRYEGERPERWRRAVDSGLWLYGYWSRGYRAEFIRVKSINPETKTIELAARNSLGNLEDGGASRYCAMPVLEELDAPGEWTLDRDRGLLFLWPPESPRTPQVVLSVNSTALLHGVNASHLEFRGLGIEGSAACGIRLDKGSDCRVVACEVRNVGTHGIAVTGDRHQILGCDVHHTGDKAIAMDSGDRNTLTRGESVLDNCHLHHTNRVVRAGSQAVSLTGVGNRFSHNLIHDTGYIAIRFAGNDHVLEYNRLFRTNVEATEGGVFYTGRDWTSRGSVIRYNFIHHVEDSFEGCGSSTRFVHLDDSAPEIDIYGNVCYRIGGGVSVCGGAANRVHDNLFVECSWGVDIGPRGKDMFLSDGKGGYTVNPKDMAGGGWKSLVTYLERHHWNQPPYSTAYPKLVEIFTKEPIAAPWFNQVRHNLAVDCGRAVRVTGMEPGWSVIEENWDLPDPGFVQADRTRLDFRLKADGPAATLGFPAIPFERIGLYASTDRRTWPVPLDLPPADWKPRWLRLADAAAAAVDQLPRFQANHTDAAITVDGVVDPLEWTPGDATGTRARRLPDGRRGWPGPVGADGSAVFQQPGGPAGRGHAQAIHRHGCTPPESRRAHRGSLLAGDRQYAGGSQGRATGDRGAPRRPLDGRGNAAARHRPGRRLRCQACGCRHGLLLPGTGGDSLLLHGLSSKGAGPQNQPIRVGAGRRGAGDRGPRGAQAGYHPAALPATGTLGLGMGGRPATAAGHPAALDRGAQRLADCTTARGQRQSPRGTAAESGGVRHL